MRSIPLGMFLFPLCLCLVGCAPVDRTGHDFSFNCVDDELIFRDVTANEILAQFYSQGCDTYFID